MAMQTTDWRFRAAVLLVLTGLMVVLWVFLRGMGRPASLSTTALSMWLEGRGPRHCCWP